MFIAFVYIFIIYYLQKTSRLEQLEYDIHTISAGDFTVELDITKEMYDDFIDNYYNPIGSKMKEELSGETYSPALYLKKYLSEEIGKMLTKSYKHRKGQTTTTQQKLVKKPTKKKVNGLPEVDEIVVKDIQFAYNNHEVITILKNRGYAIQNVQWDKVKEYDN
jgi:hypothetical protein